MLRSDHFAASRLQSRRTDRRRASRLSLHVDALERRELLTGKAHFHLLSMDLHAGAATQANVGAFHVIEGINRQGTIGSLPSPGRLNGPIPFSVLATDNVSTGGTSVVHPTVLPSSFRLPGGPLFGGSPTGKGLPTSSLW